MKLWRLFSIRSAAFVVFAVWMLILVYLSVSLSHSKEDVARGKDRVLERYERAVKDLDLMRKQNEELKKLLKEKEEEVSRINEFARRRAVPGNEVATTLERVNNSGMCAKFSQEHEVARRALDNSVRELYFYLTDQFNHNKDLPFAAHATNQMLSLLGQSAAFSNVDGADAWRTAALAKISSSFQSRLDRLQNPDDCSSARKLICQLNKGCGFGCQLHHVTYCFIVAYGTNRTLILTGDGKVWSYSKRGWTASFLPVSKCSYEQIAKDGDKVKGWMSLQESASEKVISLPIVDGLQKRPPFLPLAFPTSLASSLLTYHSNPPVFFISQFMRYLMRPSEEMSTKIAYAASKVNFDKGPIVGLQIRRTDKVNTEAAFHDLKEYMDWTEDWFRIEEYRTGKSIKRRIYIATDDPSVFSEARQKYENYEVFGDAAVAGSAQLNTRYSENSLFGVVLDIEMLARCTYLVCTFSSQVCRMGYELMQIRVGDAGDRFHSLDDIYYYGGQQSHEQVAVEAYKAELPGEIDLEVGDVIGIAGNHWNGFSKGKNRRTGADGLYPSYKAREKWITLNFP